MGEGRERGKERVRKVGGVIGKVGEGTTFTLFLFLSPYIPYNITPLPYNRPRSEAE